MFLENYGFQVIVLGDEENESISELFDDGDVSDIYLCDIDQKNDFITSLESEYDANIINVDTMYTLTDEEASGNKTYLTIMREFIDNIRNTTLG